MPSDNEQNLRDLLSIAGIPRVESAAAAYLSDLLAMHRRVETAVPNPSPSFFDDKLEAIRKSALDLRHQLLTLQNHPHAYFLVWRSSSFDVAEDEEGPEAQLPALLHQLASASDAAKLGLDGSPGKPRKRAIVQSALSFFVRFSPKQLSMTQNGSFMRFAEKFYELVEPSDRDPSVRHYVEETVREYRLASREGAPKI